MIKFCVLGVVLVVCAMADAARDKHRDNPKWRHLYAFPRWVPWFVRRKCQDRWHIAKQIGFMMPMGCVALWAVWDLPAWYNVGAFVILAGAVAVAWDKGIPKPKRWP